MTIATPISQNISAHCGFSAPQINTQAKVNNQSTFSNLLDQRCVTKDVDSSNLHNNSAINKLPLEKNNSTLSTKPQLHNIITNDNDTPDYLAINIYYDTLRSWYAPNKLKKEDGSIINISKLKTKGIYSSYKKLSELHGCSTETIRRKIVKLEKLGLIQRSFKHKETVTTKSYNRLIIYVWRHTPHFFNKHGIDQDEVGVLNPQTNHEYIAEKYNIDYHSKIEQIKSIESRGGIHKLVDTKELIEPFNKLKDRSNESNFCKNSFNYNLNLNTKIIEPKSLIDKIAENSVNCANKNSTENNIANNIKATKSKIPKTNRNGFLRGGKHLKDMLEYLTDEICNILRENSGRDFTDRAIREIIKSVSRSKKGGVAFFYHIKGFIAYLSKILSFEKRDAVKTNSTNFYIKANQTSEEQDIQKQEKYLSNIEYSLQVSPEWHLKKKLASVLEPSKAYNVLTSYKSLNIKESRAIMQLNRFIELSEIDKDIILQQIQAAHEKIDNNGDYQPVESLEIIMPTKSMLPPASTSAPLSSNITKAHQLDRSFPTREGIWGKIRESFAKSFIVGGDDLDQAWLSKLDAKVDEDKKTIELKSPSIFIKDFIEDRFMSNLTKLIERSGFTLCGIKLKNG